MKYAFVRTGLTILLLVADLLGSATQPASAQPPEVVVNLVVEISDSGGWLAFRGSLLANPSDMSRVATISVPAQTGGTKSIVLSAVKFDSKTLPNDRSTTILVTITGRMTGLPALRALVVFEQAVYQMQAGLITNDVAMTNEIVGVGGRLTEMDVSAPPG